MGSSWAEASREASSHKKGPAKRGFSYGYGGRIQTCDLRVMRVTWTIQRIASRTFAALPAAKWAFLQRTRTPVWARSDRCVGEMLAGCWRETRLLRIESRPTQCSQQFSDQRGTRGSDDLPRLNLGRDSDLACIASRCVPERRDGRPYLQREQYPLSDSSAGAYSRTVGRSEG